MNIEEKGILSPLTANGTPTAPEAALPSLQDKEAVNDNELLLTCVVCVHVYIILCNSLYMHGEEERLHDHT